MTPKCPACGTSFPYAHGRQEELAHECKKCGCPRSVAMLGPKTVARWKRQSGFKQPIRQKTRRTNKHGRRGNKITTQKGLSPAQYRRRKRREEKL